MDRLRPYQAISSLENFPLPSILCGCRNMSVSSSIGGRGGGRRLRRAHRLRIPHHPPAGPGETCVHGAELGVPKGAQ
eukprot:629958-Prorocentrum_minimum.AAC.1